jgi:nicotinamidase-related amidase
MAEPVTHRHPSLVTCDALVVACIDIQERLAAAMPRRDEVVAATARLIRAAGALAAPVIVTRQYPKGLGDTVQALHAALEDAAADGSEVVVVDKLDFDCTAEPAFMTALGHTGRRGVVIAGMEAHICVTQTAMSLKSAGYAPHVAADAVCSRRDTDRDVALARMRIAGVDVLTVESAVYEALGRAGTDEFRAVLAVIKEG